jgi:low affinity iron permease
VPLREAHRSPVSWHIFGNRGLTHIDAEFEEFAVDSGRAPERVGGSCRGFFGKFNSTAGVKPMANGNGKSGVSANRRVFSKIANGVARASGRPGVFMLALLAVLVWAITGPVYHYSDTWQLVINTGTTIVTFLMVFSFRTRRTGTVRPFRLSWTNSFA